MDRIALPHADRQCEDRPAGDDDGLLPVPGRVVSHDLGVRGDVLRGQLGRLVWLSVDPAQRLHFLEKGQKTNTFQCKKQDSQKLFKLVYHMRSKYHLLKVLIFFINLYQLFYTCIKKGMFVCQQGHNQLCKSNKKKKGW